MKQDDMVSAAYAQGRRDQRESDEALLRKALDYITGDDENSLLDPAVIERARNLITALRAALAESVQEPFGYFRAEPFGWTDCASTDEGAIPLFTAPPQRKPLTEEEIARLVINDMVKFARAIERAHGIT